MTLRAYRKFAGLTLQDVEDISGISNSYLSRLESGRVKNPGAQVLYTLARVYDVDLTKMIIDTEIVTITELNPSKPITG